MKKLLSIFVILCVLSTAMLAYSGPTTWKAEKATFKVMVRGEVYSSATPAIVVEGSTFLPLRAMGEVLGVSVEWNAKLNQAEVGMSEKSKEDATNTQTELSESEKAIWKKASWKATKATFKVMVRGEVFNSKNPPIVVEGRTFLPLRVLGDALGVKVDWNEKLRQAEVDMAAATPTTAPATSTPIATDVATTTPVVTAAPTTPVPAAPATSTPATSTTTTNSSVPAATSTPTPTPTVAPATSTPTPTAASATPTPTPTPEPDWYYSDYYDSTPTTAPATPTSTKVPATPTPTPTSVLDPYYDDYGYGYW